MTNSYTAALPFTLRQALIAIEIEGSFVIRQFEWLGFLLSGRHACMFGDWVELYGMSSVAGFGKAVENRRLVNAHELLGGAVQISVRSLAGIDRARNGQLRGVVCNVK